MNDNYICLQLWLVILCVSYHEGRERKGKRKMENACGRRFLFFLGLLVSFLSPGAEGLTWTLDSFLLSPSLSNLLILSSPFFFASSTRLYPSIRSESASICLFNCVSLSTQQQNPVSVNPCGGVCVCSCFLVCVTCFSSNTDYKSLTSLQLLSKAL